MRCYQYLYNGEKIFKLTLITKDGWVKVWHCSPTENFGIMNFDNPKNGFDYFQWYKKAFLKDCKPINPNTIPFEIKHQLDEKAKIKV